MKLVVPFLTALSLLVNTHYAQITYKANIETGRFFESAEFNLSNSNQVFKLLGNIKYKTSYKKSESSISLKIRPEFLGNDFSALKFGAQGDYVYYGKNINWKSFITYQNFGYNFNNDNYSFSSINLISGIDFKLSQHMPAQLFVGYSYQNVEFVNNISSDFIYLDSKIQSTISNYSSISYGIFIENFSTNAEKYSNSDKYSTRGWYYGPQFSINYLREFLFNVGYKFLLLSSNDLENPSFEHRVNTVGGVKLSKLFSFFIHIDFYFRNSKEKNPSIEKPTLLPTKNENHITFKINYKLKSKFSIYLKSGYFRENLFSENKHLDGLNILLGFELKN